jgi:hypothetical protein
MAQRHQAQHAHRRRSPLVIGAVASFILAFGAVVVVITRSTGKTETQTIRSVEIGEPGNVAAAPTTNSGQPVIDVSRTTRPPHDGSASAVEVPVWARSPGIWTTPYPEGGRYNPPLPEVKLPPEMVGSTPLASPDAGASADGKQLDVVDERALR